MRLDVTLHDAQRIDSPTLLDFVGRKDEWELTDP